MTTLNHTPGPWKFSFESVDPEWAIVTNPYGWVVANVNSETGPDCLSAPAMRQMPKEANARLIAAAPDLLEALKECVGELDNYRCDDQGCVQDSVVLTIRDARAIIAKAEGREG